MDKFLEKVLTHAYEVEGLLLAIERHGSDTPEVVFDALRDKASRLNDEVEQMLAHRREASVTDVASESSPVESPNDLDDNTVSHAEEPEQQLQNDITEILAPEAAQPVENKCDDTEDERVEDAPFVEPAAESVVVDAPHEAPEAAHDIAKAMSLNDRFRFARELFNDDYDRMDKALAEAGTKPTAMRAIEYLVYEAGIDPDNEAADELAEIINQLY